MNEERHPEPELDGALLPNGSEQRAEQIAGQQFVHGLLAHLHHDDDASQRRRVEAVMSAIDHAPTARRTAVRRRPRWPVASGLAAAILIIITVLLVTPSDRTALAVVRSTIDAARQASERRYEVRMLGDDGDESGPPNGRIDLRGADDVVIEFQTPFGHRVVVGRRGADTWAIRHDGTIDRFPPRAAWPRWISFGQNTFLIDTVDALVTSLTDAYDLRLEPPVPLPSGGEARFDRISAVHAQRMSAEPRRIELWIDPDSGLVERMELHWPQHVRWQPEGGGPPPRRRGPRFDGRPPIEGLPPHPDDELFDDRPRRRGDDDFRGPPPRRRGEAQRHDGPRRDGPPRRLRDDRPPPEFIDGRPDFRGGHHPPPPKEIVFTRVAVDPLDDSWFEPEAHVE